MESSPLSTQLHPPELMASLTAKLIPLDGSSPILVDRDITLVGRKPGLCDLVIDHNSISKVHCIIAKTDGLLFVRDLGSTNGTKVNGQKVSRGALLPGDELTFANTRFRVHLGPGEPPVNSYDRTEAIAAYPQLIVESEPVYELADSDDEVISLVDSASDVRLAPNDDE